MLATSFLNLREEAVGKARKDTPVEKGTLSNRDENGVEESSGTEEDAEEGRCGMEHESEDEKDAFSSPSTLSTNSNPFSTNFVSTTPSFLCF